MSKSNTQAKQAQRERDRKAGFVRYERKIKPEWAAELDALILLLTKHSD